MRYWHCKSLKLYGICMYCFVLGFEICSNTAIAVSGHFSDGQTGRKLRHRLGQIPWGTLLARLGLHTLAKSLYLV